MLLHCSLAEKPCLAFLDEPQQRAAGLWILKLLTVPEQVDPKGQLIERRTQGGVFIPTLLHDLMHLKRKSRENVFTRKLKSPIQFFCKAPYSQSGNIYRRSSASKSQWTWLLVDKFLNQANNQNLLIPGGKTVLKLGQKPVSEVTLGAQLLYNKSSVN